MKRLFFYILMVVSLAGFNPIFARQIQSNIQNSADKKQIIEAESAKPIGSATKVSDSKASEGYLISLTKN